MSTNVRRVEFDSTLDEVVDANMRLVQHTGTYRKQRTSYQWIVGVSVAGGLAVAIARRGEVPSFVTLAVAACTALICGPTVAMLYGRYHDSWVRRNYRRVIDEMYGGVQTIHCEYELRDDSLWSRSVHTEISLPWSRLTRVIEAPGSIELWFNPGLAVIRDRAFQNAEQRREFVDSVTSRRESSSLKQS